MKPYTVVLLDTSDRYHTFTEVCHVEAETPHCAEREALTCYAEALEPDATERDLGADVEVVATFPGHVINCRGQHI